MKIAPNRTRRKSARLVAYAAFQNKYICYYINKMVFENCVRQCRGRRPRRPAIFYIDSNIVK